MNELVFAHDGRHRFATQTKGILGSSLTSVRAEDADVWVWLAYDQLNVAFLEALNLEGRVGVVLIESSAKAQSRPYHQQKLGVLLSNQRHFALELEAAGYPVAYLISTASYGEILQSFTNRFGNLHCITAAERELRKELAPLIGEGHLIEHEHPGWLTPRDWFISSVGDKPPFSMHAFYITVRKQTRWIMEDRTPVAANYNIDAENRFP